ncbi:MAG TPA: hypothetical protein PLR20_08935 [Syntrophales bacterium]|nr:hypothetical protein [Syntrophales bacterium]HOX94551.1 hypothetical protein [Syntrophales bacterium]HPI57435.1 hypothetical protein [Syntrophales bacterium]HPN25708.1 hypothetical protein [Syntrophales bacterium]HQM29460.1 hypothetical protein [Syntrophales bacterium]
MKKVLYVITGAGVALILHAIIIFLFINRTVQSGGETPGPYAGLALMVVFPLCLLVGSFVSGYLTRALMRLRSTLDYLLVSPGFYAALIFLIPTFLQLRTLGRDLFIISVFSAALWIFSSFVGTRLGASFRDRSQKTGTVPVD